MAVSGMSENVRNCQKLSEIDTFQEMSEFVNLSDKKLTCSEMTRRRVGIYYYANRTTSAGPDLADLTDLARFDTSVKFVRIVRNVKDHSHRRTGISGIVRNVKSVKIVRIV